MSRGHSPKRQSIKLRPWGVLVSQVSTRRVGSDDWADWRDLRLAALLDSPDAFASTYKSEGDWTEQEWRNRLDPVNGMAVIASLDGRPVGMAAGYQSRPRVVDLVSMWVTPTARRKGVGDALVAEVVQWAKEQSASDVHLWVTRGNDSAVRLYTRHGFERTGDVRPLPSNPSTDEIAMRLRR
jgi:GNAT superfamily N-acetyltransferase